MSIRSIVLIAAAVGAAVALGYYFAYGRTNSPLAVTASEPRTPSAVVDAQTLAPHHAFPDPDDERERQHTQPRPARPPAAPPLIVSVGGEQIPLLIRTLQRSDAQLEGIDDGQSGGFFARLADTARAGNDAAALALYESLNRCKPFPKTQAEFDARIAESRIAYAQTGGVAVPGGEPQPLNVSLQYIERRFHRCEGITEDMYPTALALLRDSIERDDDNRIAYAQAISDTDPKEAHAQYELLWQRGYLAGLAGLAKDSLPHRIAALAVSIAESHILPAEQSEHVSALESLEASTSPSEFQQASREAVRILKNPSCCQR
jgi:hypothetical protein